MENITQVWNCNTETDNTRFRGVSEGESKVSSTPTTVSDGEYDHTGTITPLLCYVSCHTLPDHGEAADIVGDIPVGFSKRCSKRTQSRQTSVAPVSSSMSQSRQTSVHPENSAGNKSRQPSTTPENSGSNPEKNQHPRPKGQAGKLSEGGFSLGPTLMATKTSTPITEGLWKEIRVIFLR